MSAAIVPLRRGNERQSALARVDVIAAERLASGQASNLQVARAEIILADMQTQRQQLVQLLAELRKREKSGDAIVDEADAVLITATDLGLIQIDLFIAQAQDCVERDLRLQHGCLEASR